mmetsp:Transcript_32997/g.59720  ORF Transcript_32997/g.59720 Transcript_32997/m.59720 type:complete len:100 (-) Transcript_32997:1657-1956(-)
MRHEGESESVDSSSSSNFSDGDISKHSNGSYDWAARRWERERKTWTKQRSGNNISRSRGKICISSQDISMGFPLPRPVPLGCVVEALVESWEDDLGYWG